jgi:hypothetical protein
MDGSVELAISWLRGYHAVPPLKNISFWAICLPGFHCSIQRTSKRPGARVFGQAVLACSGFCSDPTSIRPHPDTSTHTLKRLESLVFPGGGLNRRGLAWAFLLPWAQEVPSSNLGAPTIHCLFSSFYFVELPRQKPNLGPNISCSRPLRPQRLKSCRDEYCEFSDRVLQHVGCGYCSV